jgi:alpha-beta hydrolase superfamily lysophospholipase
MESNGSILTAAPTFRDFRPGSGGRRLAVARWEQADGRELVGRVCLSHGYGEHGERYAHTAAWLQSLGWALSTQDHAGFGRSEGRRGDAEGIGPFVDDWLAFLRAERALAPDRPLVVLGHSFGGLVALLAALREPAAQDGLILSSPAVILKDRGWPLNLIERTLGRLAPHLSLDLPGNKSRVCSDEELVRRYWADPLCHRRVSAAYAQALAEGSREVLAEGAALACPTLLLQAGDDTLVNLPRAMAFWDSVNPAILERHLLAGFLHEVFHDRRRQAAQDLAARWLARQAHPKAPGTPADPAAIHA